MNLNSLASQIRPRERLHEKGAQALSDAELIALIIRTGTKNDNVLEISQNIISQYGLPKLSRMDIPSLSKIEGIGRAKASQIIACFELARRLLTNSEERKQVNNSSDIADIYLSKLSFLKKETLIAVYLDSRRKIIKESVLSNGTVNSMALSPREIFHHGIAENAAGVILIHNHPSGDSTPSDEDISTTQDVADAGDLLGIKLVDHIIVGDNNYTSLREKGLIQSNS